MNKHNLLTFENYSFQYAAQTEPTLKNINLTIAQGEKVLVLGASGSGKSTLMQAMNGLIPHSYDGHQTGRLTVFGASREDVSIQQTSERIGTV
ncbi:MAG: ATP-binding cassette domain-containing protein, partial [Bacilli bacterium]